MSACMCVYVYVFMCVCLCVYVCVCVACGGRMEGLPGGVFGIKGRYNVRFKKL